MKNQKPFTPGQSNNEFTPAMKAWMEKETVSVKVFDPGGKYRGNVELPKDKMKFVGHHLPYKAHEVLSPEQIDALNLPGQWNHEIYLKA